MLYGITSFLITRMMDFDWKIKRQEVSSRGGLLISDSSREWYYHIGTPYLDSSLQSELLKEKQTKIKLLCLWNRFWKVFEKVDFYTLYWWCRLLLLWSTLFRSRYFLSLSLTKSLLQKMEYFWVILMSMSKEWFV